MTFSKDTLDELAKPLPHDMVKTRAQAGQSLSYVEGWYALDTANRIFGFDGWSIEVVSVTVLLSERATEGKGAYKHVARVHVRVRVGDVTRDGIGVGVGSLNDPIASIELAEKAAETDAQKRALKSFGNRFGLALYDKTQEGVGASREAQRMIDEIARTENVDAWVLANKKAVGALVGADQADVKAACARRRGELAAAPATGTPEAPVPPQSQAPASPPAHPNAGPFLKQIEEARGAQALLDLAPKLMAASLNGSTKAVHRVYAARWVKVIGDCTDETTLATALAKLTSIDPVWRGQWDEAIPDAVAAAQDRCGVTREVGQEG